MKTQLLAIVLLTSLAYSSQNPVSNYQDLFARSIGASSDMNTTKSGKVSSGAGKGHIEDNYMDTVIYNDIDEKKFHRGKKVLTQENVSDFKSEGIKLASPKTEYIDYVSQKYKELKQAREKKEQAIAKMKEEKPSYFVGGYCIATKQTEIIKASSFTIYDCDLMFGHGKHREVQVFAGVYPNYQKEILVSLPLYATLPNGTRAKMSGIVMSADKTSLNVANEVESYKIRRWVAKYGLTINDVAYKYAMMYLEDLRASRRSVETVYVNSTGNNGLATTVPVQNVNVKPPSAKEMFATAGAELLSRFIAIGAENLLEDTAPLFTIYKGQRVWIEGIIDTDSGKMYGTFDKMGEQMRNNIKEENKKFMEIQTSPVKEITSGRGASMGTQGRTR